MCWQTYTAVFEAAVEGATTSRTSQTMRPLTFDLVGEGHLPTVRVSAPTLRSRAGLPLLLFHRLLVGRTQTLQLVLTNEGALQSQVGSSSCVFTSLLDVLLAAFCLLVTYATAGSAGVYYAWLLVENIAILHYSTALHGIFIVISSRSCCMF